MKELIPFDQTRAIELFKNPKDMQELLQEIERQAKDFKPDPTTPAGRKKIGSQAAMVSSSKVVIDTAKKVLTSDWAKKKKEVDALGKMAVDFCDRVRDEILDTRVQWQAKEDERAAVAAEKAETEAAELEAYAENDLWDREAKVKAIEAKLESDRIERERIEAEKLEEERRSAVFEKSIEESKKRFAREAAEAIELEREKTAQAEREAQEQREQAERDLIAAKELEQARIKQAESDKQDAIDLEKQRAKDKADQAESERLRILAMAKQVGLDRAANREIRRTVNAAIVDVLVAGGVSQKGAKTVVTLVASGKVPSMSIRY